LKPAQVEGRKNNFFADPANKSSEYENTLFEDTHFDGRPLSAFEISGRILIFYGTACRASVACNRDGMSVVRIVVRRSVIPLAALGVGVGFVAGLYALIQRHEATELESNLLRAAKTHSQTIGDFRSFYSTEVISRLSGTEVEVTHLYKDRDKSVPLPATLTIDFSEFVADQGREMQLQLLSDYPFPWRAEERAPLGGFEAEALRNFRNGNFADFSEVFTVEGTPYFRYAAPVPMSRSCVDCHNSHPDTPRADWAVGDIRGVQLVTLPITAAGVASGSQFFGLSNTFQDIILFVAAFFIFAFILAVYGQRRIAQNFSTIHALVQAERSRSEELELSRSAIDEVATRLDAVMQNINDGIVTIGTDGRIESANREALKLFGYTQDQFIGKNVSIIMPPTEAERHNEYLRRYEQRGTSDIIGTTRELLGRRSDGSDFPIELSISEVQLGDKRVFSGVVRDITQRHTYQNEIRARNAEARLLSMVASRTDNAVIITDPAGKTEWVNDGFTRITGFTLSDIQGQKPGVLLQGEETDPAVVERISRAVANSDAFSETIVNYTKAGVPYWVSVDSQPIFDETGGLTNFIAIERDITDIKNRETELEAARQAAEDANKAKSEFLATMSHEIRTPMNGVIGMTGLLLDKPLGDEQRRFARTIRESSEALLQIINDILDFSKVDAGQLAPEVTTFELAPLMQGTIEILWPRANAKGISLLSSLPLTLHRPFVGDPGRLRQVLLNLIGNAVKFTDTGTVTLRVSDATHADETRLRFEISDTGVGISEAEQNKVFQSFRQLDSSSSRRYEGTGLGLAISRKLIELMGGEIGVASVLGEGSTFWLEVPLVRAETTPNNTGSTLKPILANHLLSQATSLVGRSLLIIDEAPLSGDLLRDMTQDWGMEVELTPTLEAGVRRMSAQDHDVVLLNCARITNLEATFAKVMKKQNTQEPLRKLIVCAPDESENSVPLMDWNNVDARLAKPLMQRSLLGTLHRLFTNTPETSIDPDHSFDAEWIPPTRKQRRLRILLAEDNPINQQVATGYLKNFGHHVDVAGNGIEAVKAVQDLPYDMVFMDVQMPEMDGLEATRAIRALPHPTSTIPIIAMTANAMLGDREHCLEAGMDGYLSKPIEGKRLYRVIEDLLQTPSQAPPPSAKVSETEGTSADVTSALPSQAEPQTVDQSIIGQLRDQLGETTVGEIIAAFFEDTTHRLKRAHNAADALDATLISEQAHSIKGSAASLGFESVAQAAQALETALQPTSSDDALSLALASLDQALRDAEASVTSG